MNQTSLSAASGRALNAPVDALHSGIRSRLFLRESAVFCAAALFLAGGIVLVWRLAFSEWPRNVVIAASVMLVAVALFVAWLRAIQLTPPKHKLLVWLDAHADCGGFLAASLETDCSAWASNIRIP